MRKAWEAIGPNKCEQLVKKERIKAIIKSKGRNTNMYFLRNFLLDRTGLNIFF